jgi:hypothetical protein
MMMVPNPIPARKMRAIKTCREKFSKSKISNSNQTEKYNHSETTSIIPVFFSVFFFSPMITEQQRQGPQQSYGPKDICDILFGEISVGQYPYLKQKLCLGRKGMMLLVLVVVFASAQTFSMGDRYPPKNKIIISLFFFKEGVLTLKEGILLHLSRNSYI